MKDSNAFMCLNDYLDIYNALLVKKSDQSCALSCHSFNLYALVVVCPCYMSVFDPWVIILLSKFVPVNMTSKALLSVSWDISLRDIMHLNRQIFPIKLQYLQWGATMISVVNFFVFLRILFFCFVVAIYDLVHDVESIFHIQHLEIFSEI